MAERKKEDPIINPEVSSDEGIYDILVEKKESSIDFEQDKITPDSKQFESGFEGADAKATSNIEHGPIIDDQIKINDGAVVAPTVTPDFKQKQLKEINKILADGLDEIYLKMNPNLQKEFKTKGEETSLKINALLEKTKVKVNKIFSLIKDWLKIIPGVNKFFLEREAKIKTDKIIKLQKEEKREEK